MLATPTWANPEPVFAPMRSVEVIEVGAGPIRSLLGTRIESLVAFRCDKRADTCTRVALQIDSRDSRFRWVMDGPDPGEDDVSPGFLDDNDVLLLLASDAGNSRTAPSVPDSYAQVLIEVRDPIDGNAGFFHLFALRSVAPAFRPAPLIHYEIERERFVGPRVALAYRDGIPQSLELTGTGEPRQILDRIKIRAGASLLWGLLRFHRNEADLTTDRVAWRRGPIRGVRHQLQRVRLGWGIRSPQFSSYTLFSPYSAELPVSLRLNHPPAALFGNVRIEILLDFIDLTGWELLLPDRAPLRIGHDAAAALAKVDLGVDWFALRSSEVVLVQILEISPSLASTRRRLVYRESDRPNPPESVPGEQPAIGYRIDRWDDVDAGDHHIRALCFALDPQIDVAAFLAAYYQPLATSVISEQRPGEAARSSSDAARIRGAHINAQP